MRCIAYERPKLAALLFDEVLPLPSYDRLMSIDASNGGNFVEEFHNGFYDGASAPEITQILPNNYDQNHLISNISLCFLLRLNAESTDELENFIRDVRANKATSSMQAELFLMMYEQLKKYSDSKSFWQEWVKSGLRVDTDNKYEIFGVNDLAVDGSNIEQPFLQLVGVPVVDDDSITWEQVLEIRKDNDALHKLRRFRNFCIDNYDGKSREYIEDDIATRVYDYKSAAKEQGLKIMDSIFSVNNSVKLLTATGAVTAAALFAPATALVATAGLAPIIAGVAFNVATKKKLFEIEQNKDPIRYIIDINDKSKSNKE